MDLPHEIFENTIISDVWNEIFQICHMKYFTLQISDLSYKIHRIQILQIFQIRYLKIQIFQICKMKYLKIQIFQICHMKYLKMKLFQICHMKCKDDTKPHLKHLTVCTENGLLTLCPEIWNIWKCKYLTLIKHVKYLKICLHRNWFVGSFPRSFKYTENGFPRSLKYLEIQILTALKMIWLFS